VVLQVVTNVSEEPAVSVFTVDTGTVEVWSCYRRKVNESTWGSKNISQRREETGHCSPFPVGWTGLSLFFPMVWLTHLLVNITRLQCIWTAIYITWLLNLM